MHRAVVLSVFSSAFLVLATLSGTTGEFGSQQFYNSYEDDLGESPFEQSSNSRNPYEHMKPFKQNTAKKGWKDLHGGGWGKRDSPDFTTLNGFKNYLANDNFPHQLPMSHDFKGTSGNGFDQPKRFLKEEKREEDFSKSEYEPNSAWEKVPLKTFFNKYSLPSVSGEYSKYGGYQNGENGKRDWNSFQEYSGKRESPFHSSDGLSIKRAGNGKWERLNGSWG